MRRLQVADPLTLPGSWPHLSARLLDVITASALDRAERRQVREWLGEGPSADAFFAQPVPDQRHGYEAAAYVAARREGRPDLIRAALLHDIGKRHARLGALGRAWASLVLRLGLPAGPRVALYRDHGELGAAELAEGEPPLVVAFTRHHHQRRPAEIPTDEWQLLVASDRARRRSLKRTEKPTSMERP